MKTKHQQPPWLAMTVLAAAFATATTVAAAPPTPAFDWTTVVNNNVSMPGAPLNRTFNSYNQPSVNLNGLVVMRARSIGGGGQPATHGIYTRDMSVDDSEIIRILDRTTAVPQPNNLGTTFVETPSFPRIDMDSDTIATRGNHQPVWRYLLADDTETRAGTTGIYTNPFGPLITGASKLGDVPDFSFFEVPEFPGIRFEVFPGAPSVTEGDTIVFKGNYTAPDGSARTGVYYRELVKDESCRWHITGPAGGTSPVVLIANSTDTFIPGTDTVFGSTAPPSAAGQRVVFAGFDDEDAPTLGGIYLASLQYQPRLDTLVSIGQRVPGESATTPSMVSVRGVRSTADLWASGAPGAKRPGPCASTARRKATRTASTIAIKSWSGRRDTGEMLGAPNIECDDTGCYQEKEVPVNQGIFVHDIKTHRTRIVAKTGAPYDEFLFWNFSGKTPCVGGGHSEEGAETTVSRRAGAPRRSSPFRAEARPSRPPSRPGRASWSTGSMWIRWMASTSGDGRRRGGPR